MILDVLMELQNIPCDDKAFDKEEFELFLSNAKQICDSKLEMRACEYSQCPIYGDYCVCSHMIRMIPDDCIGTERPEGSIGCAYQCSRYGN